MIDRLLQESKSSNSFLYPILLLLIFSGTIFINSDHFVSPENSPQYYFFVGALLLVSVFEVVFNQRLQIPSYSLFTISLLTLITTLALANRASYGNLITLLCIILWGLFCLQMQRTTTRRYLLIGLFLVGIGLAIYGVLQYVRWLPSNHMRFAVTGRFDNPAGFAATLALIFPIGLFLLLKEKNRGYLQWLFAGGLLVLLLALVLSGSRTGILSVIASSGLLLGLQLNLLSVIKRYIPHWEKIIPVSLLALLVISVVTLYALNVDSANGRLLIWRVSADMIADKPLFGHGPDSFQAKYMDYQAAYFAKHPNSPFRQLADNVKHPFNEYVLILVEYGVLEIIMLGLSLGFLFYEIRKTKCRHYHLSLGGLLGLLTFCFFSYPMQYVSVWILGIFYLSMSIQVRPVTLLNKPLVILGKLVFVGVMLTCLYITVDEVKARMAWNNVAQNSLNGNTTQMLPKYEKLYTKLNNNPFFLYNYGAELSVAGKYEKSTAILRECQMHFNDYDLQLLLAKNYEAKGNLKKAKAICEYASTMIPARFWPLYKLVKIYRKQNKMDRAEQVAQKILDKKVKVPSSTISSIKYEIEKFLEESKSNH